MHAAQVSLESKTSDFGNETVGMEISPSASEPSAEALTALDTLSFYVRSSLVALCEGRAYEKFTSAWKLLTEQGMIPSTITSVLKDILESLDHEQ
ncbi:hypothetical protein FF1_014093 [Malus domestica]